MEQCASSVASTNWLVIFPMFSALCRESILFRGELRTQPPAPRCLHELLHRHFCIEILSCSSSLRSRVQRLFCKECLEKRATYSVLTSQSNLTCHFHRQSSALTPRLDPVIRGFAFCGFILLFCSVGCRQTTFTNALSTLSVFTVAEE